MSAVPGDSPEARHAEIRRLAAEWLIAFEKNNPQLPPVIQHIWNNLCGNLDEPIPDKANVGWSPDQHLLDLLAIADQACTVAHLRGTETDANGVGLMTRLRFRTHTFLKRNGQSSTCDEIPSDKLRVLPKTRAPQKGMTIRSLSLYACLVEGQEINPRIENAIVKDDLTLNALVVPWPFEVRPAQLSIPERNPSHSPQMPPGFDFFTFSQQPFPSDFSKAFCNSITTLIEEAEQDTGKIRLVILPELALDEETVQLLASSLLARGTNVVAGVGAPSTTSACGKNYVYFSLIANAEPARQHKHHRWKLDESQIRQYSAGSQLHIGSQYWEHIDISDRTLSFVQLQSWLNACVLICEDLARPDPVGDIIRAVGPNLTVALLMDGPQLKERWSARHATILAEDPGSSVLTVTSLGMSELSKPLTGQDRSRVIALWKEAGSTTAQEIELPPGKNAMVLSLSMKEAKDWAADGRYRTAATPALTGVRFYSMPQLSASPNKVS